MGNRERVCALVLMLIVMESCFGQADIDRYGRTLERIRREQNDAIMEAMPADKRALIDYGGYFTTSYLSVDDENLNNRALRQYDLTGYARLNLDNVNEFYVRGRTFYQDFNSGDGEDGRPDHMEGRVEEAYYRLDLAEYARAYQHSETSNRLGVTVGRQLTEWANGLVLSQYLDAVRVDAGWGSIDAELLGGITASYTVDFDSTRKDFDNDTRRGFYGLLTSVQLGKHRPYVYALIQSDYNSDDTFVVSDVPTKYTYDSYYLGAGVNGALSDRLVYRTELTFEGGSGLSSVFNTPSLRPQLPQERDQIEAGAADARLDYLLLDERHTRLSGELIMATGDPDRIDTSSTIAGNQPGTRDHAFNAWGVINDGSAFSPAISNVLIVRAGASTFPLRGTSRFDKLELTGDLFVYNKFRTHAPIDEATDNGRYLGIEPDVGLNWQVVEDVTLQARYGIFFPSDIVFANDKVRQFIYLSVTCAF